MNAGYQVSQFHKCPEAVKTNAPHHVLWDIMRCWIKKHPLGKRRLTEDTPGNRILAQEPKLEANFTVINTHIHSIISRRMLMQLYRYLLVFGIKQKPFDFHRIQKPIGDPRNEQWATSAPQLAWKMKIKTTKKRPRWKPKTYRCLNFES